MPPSFDDVSFASTRKVTQREFAAFVGKVFGSSQGYELPTGDTLEPDASFVSSERWAAGPRPREGAFLRIVPDLVVEVLSKTTAARDRGEKRKAYARAGVRELWLIVQRAREIVLLVRVGRIFAQRAALSGRERLRSVVLAGLVVALGDVFPR